MKDSQRVTEMRRQREQLHRFAEWERTQGTEELPVQLDTYQAKEQEVRIQWLRQQVIGTVLEVGCNWGYVLAAVKGQAGVEINPYLVAVARLLARDRQFFIGSALALPVPDASYDTVMLPEVLEHLEWPDVPNAIAEARRVARKRIIITIPDGEEETVEATSFKHRWLCTRDRLDALCALLPTPTVTAEPPFLYIVARIRVE